MKEWRCFYVARLMASFAKRRNTASCTAEIHIPGVVLSRDGRKKRTPQNSPDGMAKERRAGEAAPGARFIMNQDGQIFNGDIALLG
jgi:hypothetical protein